MSFRHRKSTIQKILGVHFAPGTSYMVTAQEEGAIASANSSGGTITVYEGHGVVAGDHLLIDPGGANTFTAAVDSVTATTLVLSPETYSVSAGMKIANLGADTGVATPNYDGSGLTIYSDPGVTVDSNETVSTSSTGEYEYWISGTVTVIWELVRDSSGEVVDLNIVEYDFESGTTALDTVEGTATSENRGVIKVITGGAGVEDYAIISLKSASDTYSWVLVAAGGS